MNQEKYIGMDVHQATISVAVMDSSGKLIMACSATLHPHSALPPNQSLLRVPCYLFPATILRFCTSPTRSLIFCPLARLTRAVQKLPPLHSICIRTASAAPERLPSNGFIERAPQRPPHLQPSPEGAPPIKH